MTLTCPLPSFLGLGTQKGGTTTLHTWLKTHPQVFLPALKEVHFFDLQYEKPNEWYAGHFKTAGPNQLCGEITPFYLFHPDVPARIKRLIPHAKLIVLLRDPVERTLSQVFHAQRLGFEALDVAEALEAETERLASGSAYSFQKHSYVSRSCYLEQLERYEKLFNSDQILVMKSEDLFNHSRKIWHKLINFLELQECEPQIPIPHSNAGSGKTNQVDPSIRNQLRDQLHRTAKGVRERYGFGWEWEKTG